MTLSTTERASSVLTELGYANYHYPIRLNKKHTLCCVRMCMKPTRSGKPEWRSLKDRFCVDHHPEVIANRSKGTKLYRAKFCRSLRDSKGYLMRCNPKRRLILPTHEPCLLQGSRLVCGQVMTRLVGKISAYTSKCFDIEGPWKRPVRAHSLKKKFRAAGGCIASYPHDVEHCVCCGDSVQEGVLCESCM